MKLPVLLDNLLIDWTSSKSQEK